MIKVESLTKIYGKDNCVIDDISFELPEKGMVCITGESGSGKSTLLNCLYGAEDYNGKIYINGILVERKNIDAIRKQYISMVYQDFGLIEDMTVEANLRLAFESVGEKFSDERLSKIMQKLGLDDRHKTSKCKNLSGGEKQRVAIARALAQKSSIIFADEPTGSLDSDNSKAIFELLKKLSAQMLVVIVTHNEQFAMEYGDYYITLCDGKIEKTNLPKNITLNCKQSLKKRKSLLSLHSFFDIFKWSFTSKITVVLLSIFSVVFLAVSMMLSAFLIVERNDVVVKNLKYNEEHTFSFEVAYGNQIDKEIFANCDNVCYGYRLQGNININGQIPEDYQEKDPVFIYSAFPRFEVVIECEDISKIGGKILYGRNPQSPTEIAINHYFAKWMINNFHLYDGEVKTKEEELLGVKLSGLEIVGIIDSKLEQKISLAKLDKVDYLKSEVFDIDDSKQIMQLHNLISLDFDASVITAGYGFAEQNGIVDNCYSAYLSSTTADVDKLLDCFKEDTHVKLNSRYTYSIDNTMQFFADNHKLFTILTVVLTTCAILFIVVATYIVLKSMAQKILVLRSIGLDKSKLLSPIIISQLAIVLLQLVIAMCCTFLILSAINSKIMTSLIVPFTTLFTNWSFTGIVSSVSVAVVFVLVIVYLLILFSKTLNYQKQKN